MKVASIGRQRAGQADDFKVPGCSTAIRDIGKSNVVVSQRTHAGGDPTRFDLVGIDKLLDRFLEILSGFQSQDVIAGRRSGSVA